MSGAQGNGEPGFEAALARLEEIAAKLERGEATLDEGLALFEEGIGLARRCQGLLADAEDRVRRLTAEGSGFSLTPFAAGDEEAEE